MQSPAESASRLLVQHANAIIALAAVVTALLVVPMLLWTSDVVASTEPGGEIFDLRDEIDAKLGSGVFITAYIAEARGGDMLLQAPLLELLRNGAALRSVDQLGDLAPPTMARQPYLIESFDISTGFGFLGLFTVADAVDAWLRFALSKGLEDASDDEVKLAVHGLVNTKITEGLRSNFSVLATNERKMVLGQQIDYWESPALLFAVHANNEALGGTSGFRSIAANEAGRNIERFTRNIQATMRGDQETYALWGLAIDQTLAAEEQGATAGLFIVLTVIAALAVVGASLRAYWPTALTAVGLGILMIWLKGLSALVGIKGGLIVELIVPIAMVSLGVDFAVHAARRYQEERHLGIAPSAALRVGMAGVIGALLLAMLSDGIAFLSNVPSGIEAVVHFGLAAGIATLSSFMVLGIVLPLALMKIDELLDSRPSTRTPGWVPWLAAGGVTALTGAGVILLVAVDMAIGAGVLLSTAALFILVPLTALHLRKPTETTHASSSIRHSMLEGAWVERMVTGLATRRRIVLPAAAVLTAASVVLALRLEATFDVKDFFAEDSDLVVGLDKLDEHVGDRSGEGGIVFIRGDLGSPEALTALDAFVESLGANPYLGKSPDDGRPSIFDENLLNMVTLVMESEYARTAVEERMGVLLTDEDGNFRPDTRTQVQALFDFMTTYGVPRDSTTDIYSAGVVREALFYDPASPSEQITLIYVGIPGTRELSLIALARSSLLQDLAPLKDVPGITQVGLTGSPFLREAELTATVDNLRRSLPVAAVGALLLLLIAFRSIRYAVVTILPIGLVVAWLYAIMELAGFALNFVSATIGAVSIGVGIDYSIHMTERFREELGRTGTRVEALRRAARGTGVALLASAGSSIVGFAIMAFAPMPMFSTYGLLTALMIFLALVAALVVLPSLLMLVSSEPQPKRRLNPLAATEQGDS
jgi:predicted RND superfamily exporter protein